MYFFIGRIATDITHLRAVPESSMTFSREPATFLSKTSTFAITRSRSTRSYSGWVQINIQQHSYVFYIFFSSNSSGARSSDPKQLGGMPYFGTHCTKPPDRIHPSNETGHNINIIKLLGKKLEISKKIFYFSFSSFLGRKTCRKRSEFTTNRKSMQF